MSVAAEVSMCCVYVYVGNASLCYVLVSYYFQIVVSTRAKKIEKRFLAFNVSLTSERYRFTHTHTRYSLAVYIRPNQLENLYTHVVMCMCLYIYIYFT